MQKAKPPYLLRTRFGDIVSEYLPPERKSRKVAVLCGGMPGYPGGGRLARTLAARGYWVFIPRYRGSWESGGIFLQKSPHEDVLAVISGVEKGFVDAWSGTKHSIVRPQVVLVGSSFGGPAVLLASRDPRVRSVIALAPVIDWRAMENTVEPIAFIERFVRDGFGQGYRTADDAWKKLASGSFYNPATALKNVDGKKVLMVHSRDDEVVPCAVTKAFAKDIGATFVELRSHGHLGLSRSLHPVLWRHIEKRLK